MLYAFFDATGRVNTAHNDDTVTDLPAGATELTTEQFGQRFNLLLNNEVLIHDPLPISIDKITEGKWELIKSERDRRRFNGGVQVAGHWFKSDAIATSEYNSLVLLASALPDNAVLRAGWRTMDGATVDMTPVLVRQILTAGFAQVAAIDDAAMAHKAALANSPAPATYDYSAGWPAIFEG